MISEIIAFSKKTIFFLSIYGCFLVLISCGSQSQINLSETQITTTITPVQPTESPVSTSITLTEVDQISTLPVKPTDTSTPIPTTIRPTRTLIPTPTITLTPKLLVITPDPNSLECPRPEDLQDTEVNMSGPPFCIVWIDKFDDELGYRISLNYFQSGEHFIYEILGSDIVQFIVPEADAPRLDESLEQCRRRKDIEVFITAIRPIGDWLVDSTALETHCPLSLPTATISP